MEKTLNLLTARIKKYREELKSAPKASFIFDGQALHWVGRSSNDKSGRRCPAVADPKPGNLKK